MHNVEDPMKRRTFLLKQANAIIKEKPNKQMIDLRHDLRREGKNLAYYLPIMENLAREMKLQRLL